MHKCQLSINVDIVMVYYQVQSKAGRYAEVRFFIFRIHMLQLKILSIYQLVSHRFL